MAEHRSIVRQRQPGRQGERGTDSDWAAGNLPSEEKKDNRTRAPKVCYGLKADALTMRLSGDEAK